MVFSLRVFLINFLLMKHNYLFNLKTKNEINLSFKSHFRGIVKIVEKNKKTTLMKIFENSGIFRFLGISAIALLICPVYLFLALCVLKGLYYLKTFSWTKSPPFSTHFHWLLSYFVRIFFFFLFIDGNNWFLLNIRVE